MRQMRSTIFLFLALVTLTIGTAAQVTGKRPVIIIPGVTGSQLVNTKTGTTAWFSLRRDKVDDIRLPMTSPILARDRDNLKPTDIIRKVELPVLPDVEVYQSLIDALIARGYKEGDWNHPQATDVFYVFAYDWRRDNVESAHLLMQKMADVKRSIRRPDLKFDILAHSMGGLIARYAAMYGMSDLPREGAVPVPNWSGAASIDKLMMFGTPNEGSYTALAGLLNGYPIVASRKLPFVDDFRAEDVFTAPAAFQMLPHGAAARFFDEDMHPIAVDLYNVDTWLKYGWGAISDPKFLGKLKDARSLSVGNKEIKPTELKKDANFDDILTSRTTYAQVRAYLASVLSRAKRFQAALDVPVTKLPFLLYAYGGNCQPTPDGAILFHDEKKEVWQTVIDAREIKTVDGKVIKKEEVKNSIYGPGDGTVSLRSLLASNDALKPGETAAAPTFLLTTSTFFACGSHTQLFLDKPIQDSFLSALVVEQQAQP